MWETIIRSEESPYVWILPANEDNFAYFIMDPESKEAAVVDGVCVEEIKQLTTEQNATLKYILTTHHHSDHSSGDALLKQLYPGAQNGKTSGSLGSNLVFEAIRTPVHTMDHVCFYFTPQAARPFVFTGDFLFRSGCGYFFEGTPSNFDSSVKALFDKCDRETTLMYYGHEYCAANFEFAEFFDPANDGISHTHQKVLELIPKARRTPSTLKEELELNVFVRAVLRPDSIPRHHREAASESNSQVPLCGYVREAKNIFKK